MWFFFLNSVPQTVRVWKHAFSLLGNVSKSHASCLFLGCCCFLLCCIMQSTQANALRVNLAYAHKGEGDRVQCTVISGRLGPAGREKKASSVLWLGSTKAAAALSVPCRARVFRVQQCYEPKVGSWPHYEKLAKLRCHHSEVPLTSAHPPQLHLRRHPEKAGFENLKGQAHLHPCLKYDRALQPFLMVVPAHQRFIQTDVFFSPFSLFVPLFTGMRAGNGFFHCHFLQGCTPHWRQGRCRCLPPPPIEGKI